MKKRPYIPIGLKLFGGMILVLLVSYIGGSAFFYQFIKLKKMVGESVSVFFRIAKEEQHIDQLRDARRYAHLMETISVPVKRGKEKKYTEEIIDRLVAATKLAKKKHPRERKIDYLLSELQFLKKETESCFENIRNGNFSAVSDYIFSETLKERMVSIRSLIKRLPYTGLEGRSDTLAIIPDLLKTAYYLERGKKSLVDLHSEWDSFKTEPLHSAADSISTRIDSLLLFYPPDRENMARFDSIGAHLEKLVQRTTIDEKKRVRNFLVESQRRAAAAKKAILWSTLLSALVSIAVAVFLSRRISAPIHTLRKATHRASLGKYDQEIPVISHDEVAQLTDDFNKMLRALSELDEMKSHFTATVTHDLKSPIARIKQRIENIQDGIYGTPPDWMHPLLNDFQRDIKTLSTLIYNILDMRRIEEEQLIVREEKVPVVAVTREILSRHIISFSDRGVGLSFHSELGDMEITTDRDHLERIVDNLLTNALKYTPKGSSVVVRLVGEGGFIRLSVADSGPGIPNDLKPYLFDRFYQVKPGGVEGAFPRGTGLGLTIVKELVEALGGRVWVEDNPDGGTIFSFTIPVREEAKE